MGAPEKPEITRTTRDHEELRARLESWLALRTGDASITELEVPENGMSSETVMFDAEWTDGSGALVARIAAAGDAVPVFPSYDLDAQFRVMQLVAERTAAPVPTVRWLENDAEVLGAPFFVMDRLTGRVPPDVLPYTFEGFVLDATDDERRTLQDRSVDVLAEVHRTDVSDGAAAFLDYDQPGDTPLRRHVNHWIAYRDWVLDGRDVPLLTEAFNWLEANWPTAADSRPPALSWGDARIGNMMYDGFEPIAVFDWEMAAIAPVEVDLGWMCFLHTFFQDITEEMELPGLPHFMAADDVAARYREVSGIDVEDLHWFMTYAAARHGAIMLRIHDRQAHFGDTDRHDDPEDAIMHRARLRQMIGAG